MFTIDSRSHEPVYRQLKRQLQDKIEQNEFNVGEQVPSIRELARITRLSYVSVAKAVAELIREGVLERQRGRGAFVAKRRKTPERRTGAIGITGQFMERTLFADPYYSQIMRGAEPVLYAAHRAVLFHIRQESLVSTFNRVPLDGVLFFGSCLRSEAEVRDIVEYPCPVVVVGESVRDPNINYVNSDNLNDSTAAVEQLIQSGCRRIAIIVDLRSFLATPKLRFQGYQMALAKHGLEMDASLVLTSGDPDRLAESVLKLAPDAVFDTCHDAPPLVERLLKAGRRIPDDLAILTYDDYDDELSKLGVPYMAVKQPGTEIGSRAAKLLLDLVSQSVSGPIRLNLPSTLVHREPTEKHA